MKKLVSSIIKAGVQSTKASAILINEPKMPRNLK